VLLTDRADVRCLLVRLADTLKALKSARIKAKVRTIAIRKVDFNVWCY